MGRLVPVRISFKGKCFSQMCIIVLNVFLLQNILTFFLSQVEDAFYKGELRLNGEKLWKKSRTVRYCDMSFVCCSASTQLTPLQFPMGLSTWGSVAPWARLCHPLRGFLWAWSSQRQSHSHLLFHSLNDFEMKLLSL